MKTAKLTLLSGMLIGLASTAAHAGNTFVDLDLKVGMEVSASGIKRHKTGTTKCNPFGRDPDIEHFSVGPHKPVSAAGNGRVTEESASRSYPLNINYADAHYILARNLTVQVQNKTEKNGTQTVTVTLQDQQTPTRNDTNRGTCSSTDWVAKASHDSLNGSIRIGYKMPDNVWAVRVIRQSPTGIFKGQWKTDKTPTSGFQGDLMNYFDGKISGEEKVVWATPGSEVFQEITFKDLVNGGVTNGSVGLQFLPIAKDTIKRKNDSFASPLRETPAPEILAIMDEDLTDLKSTGFKDKVVKNRFIDHAISLIALPSVLKKFTTDNRTDAMFRVATSLAEIANGGRTGDQLDNVQAAATILAYEVALNLLDDIGPYCDLKEVDLPFTGERVSVSGLRMSFLYMSRAKARVENYRFSQYSAYLDQLREWENARLTYSAVRTDRVKLAQMQKAYEALKLALAGNITPFKGALHEMRYVLSRFKSVGAGEQATQEIFARLEQLAQEEDGFVRDFVLRLRQFKASNNAVVLASDLQERLSQIESGQEKVISLLNGTVRLLSLDGNSGVDSFVGMIQGLISHNVDIFTKPLKHSEFEHIRKVYLQEQRVKETVQQANKCILEGVAQ